MTSTLQQAASTRLGFGVKKTMMMAQRLYGGRLHHLYAYRFNEPEPGCAEYGSRLYRR
ncbi:hypothetical protein DMH17_12150 [Raoultella planticola]|nr:hypothetical protein [Raoultella planticola]